MAYIAPAGTPISPLDLLLGFGAGMLSPAPARALTQGLLTMSGREQGWLLSSGRAAMTFILNAMRQSCADARKIEVVVPAYTCYSVPAAVERAGLKVRLCDIDPATLSYDLEQLNQIDYRSVLAIVTANLYGFPNDLASIERVAASHGVFLLDDAAQTLGARIAGRPVGGFGDVGLYSFDKGKNIATMQGGAIVAGEGALANALQTQFATLQKTPSGAAAALMIKAAAYSVLLRPRAYGIVRRLPFLGLGQTPYETACLEARFSPALAGLGARLLPRLDKLTAQRRANGRALSKAVEAIRGLRNLALLPTAEPAYVRLPVLVDDPAKRAGIVAALDRAGIGATMSYPRALCDVEEARAVICHVDNAFAGARHVASTIMTLPTHPYCSSDLPERVSIAVARRHDMRQ